jgi:predicted CXXCH cytochrome family protein
MEHIMRIVSLILLLAFFVFATDDEDCLDCHSDHELVSERGAKTYSVFVDDHILNRSVHNELACDDCHSGIDLENHPDEEEIEPVNCAECHDDVDSEFMAGVHGTAYKQNKAYAPHCVECHGSHNILGVTNPKSTTYKTNIPFLCGKCHREGAPVDRVYQVSEDNILQNYSLSIHGEGLFKKGLMVTAACVDCHNSHLILPHTDPKSSISPQNISETCMKCHTRIEDVHKKIIEGNKWEKSPGSIPTCTDCHLPHKARKESVLLTLSDNSCLKCHSNQNLHKMENGEKISLFTDKNEILNSTHSEITCVKCHSDVDPRLKRPCKTAEKTECSSCHIEAGDQYHMGGHSTAREAGVENAPDCITCHGKHNIKASHLESSKTYRAKIPELCGECHSKDSQIIETQELSETDAFVEYSKSVHGKGLEEKGLLPSAICTDCHTAHNSLNHKDPRSSVHHKNIPATCSSCHKGIYNEFISSIHYKHDEKKGDNLPSCTHCHSSHTIQAVEQDAFMTEVNQQCGSCHTDLSQSYLETFHGKAYQLGSENSAKCSDCHGSHHILPASDPASMISMHNIVKTCQSCHEDANQRFTGYLTHATHHDRDKYPILYYTYWAMTTLLISVFTFFGLHTLLWLPRSIREMKRKRKEEKEHKTRYYIRRFNAAHRITHLFVIITFLSLALTGMILKFSGMAWAQIATKLIGGVEAAGIIHRIAAVMTAGYFIAHLTLLVKRKRKTKQSLFEFIFGPNSMMFNLKDIKDFWATIKWFLGFGPRPEYGRWTYWEKFDYFAVFWGVFVIGLSGLMLWLPELFTQFVPGWMINVATIVHSDEALLAVGFIFTIHFFNTHLRPEAFPMDKVIFTGLVPLEEYKKDRPEEYKHLKESGELKKVVVKNYVSSGFDRLITFFGYSFLLFGLTLVVLIIYSLLVGYQ